MSRQIAALAAVFLITASVSDAQTPYGYSNQALQLCGPAQKDYSKKQAELVKVQTRISNLMGAIAVLREGIEMQQDFGIEGKSWAAGAGVAGAAKVTKAMSDAFLNITEPYAPIVKKVYDGADALVAAGYAIYDAKGAQASANGLDAIQSAADARLAYLKAYKGDAIRPAKTQTAGVVSSAVQGADALRRGDFAGAASHTASGTEQLLDSAAKNGKSGLRIVSNVTGMLADTPEKTDESRFADGLSAVGEAGKMMARTAGGRQDYAVARMASSAGRVFRYSGVMLEQVGNVKQGLADTATMIDEYKAIDERSTSTQKKMQRQIDSKLEEIEKLRGKERELQLKMNQVLIEGQSCEQPTATRQTRAAAPPQALRPSPYVWDRQASRDRLERAKYSYERAMRAKQPPPAPAVAVAQPSATSAGGRSSTGYYHDDVGRPSGSAGGYRSDEGRSTGTEAICNGTLCQ